jgi:hypothetical protein
MALTPSPEQLERFAAAARLATLDLAVASLEDTPDLIDRLHALADWLEELRWVAIERGQHGERYRQPPAWANLPHVQDRPPSR